MDRRRSSTTPNRHATGPSTPGHVAPLSPGDGASTRSVLPVLQGNQATRRPSSVSTASNKPPPRSSTMTLMLALNPEQSPPNLSPPNLSPPALSPSSSSSGPSSPSAGGGGLIGRFKKMRGGSISSQGTRAEPPSSSSGTMANQWPNNSDDLLGVREIPGRGAYDNFDQRTISSMYTTSSGSTNTTGSGPANSVPSFISEYTLDSALQSNPSLSHASHGDHRSQRSHQAGADWASTTSKGAGGSSESLPFSLAETESGQPYVGSDPRASSIYMDPWERNR